MNANDFIDWQEHTGFSDAEAARRLGIGSRNTIAKYRAEGAPEYIGLACAAVARQLPGWKASLYELRDGDKIVIERGRMGWKKYVQTAEGGIVGAVIDGSDTLHEMCAKIVRDYD